MADRITYVGLDVHKEGIVVAVAEGGLRGEVREYGRNANTAGALDRLMRKLGGAGVRLRLCYEAGPCGYGIQRHLSAHGHDCVVVAPSLIPKRAGDRVKTDRRDAASLARLHRAGELTAVWVPDAAHEAMRDLVRARLDAVHALRRARQQLSGFLLLLHAAHPAGGLDPEMGKLLLEGTSTRLGLALTGYENGAPAGQEIETSPLVGQHQRIAQRGAGEARRSDAHASGAGGDRPHQYHRVKPGFGENRVANPHRIPARRLGIRRQLQHLRHGGRADDDAAIGCGQQSTPKEKTHLSLPAYGFPD
jgi:Transposase